MNQRMRSRSIEDEERGDLERRIALPITFGTFGVSPLSLPLVALSLFRSFAHSLALFATAAARCSLVARSAGWRRGVGGALERWPVVTERRRSGAMASWRLDCRCRMSRERELVTRE